MLLYWWGRGDLNPGPRTPQARILDQTGPRPHVAHLQPSAVRGKLINTLFRLKNLGHPESTIKSTSDKLLYLAKNSNLDNPENVKTFIARKKVKNSYKATLVKAYNHYVQTNGLTGEKPRYKWERELPRIPTSGQVNKILPEQAKNI